MAAPNAPMPLARQVNAAASIVVTVPLIGMGPMPGFVPGGTTFNSGNPTATYTIALGSGQQDTQTYELLHILDNLQRSGSAVVT